MTVVIGGRASGMEDYASREYPDAMVVTDYEKTIRLQMKEGKDPLYEAEKYLGSLPENAVLVLTEMGCGMVPAEQEERKFRDMNGQVNCLFARHADRVIRVLAGIGQVIK